MLARVPDLEHLLGLVQQGCEPAQLPAACAPALVRARADLATYLATLLTDLFDRARRALRHWLTINSWGTPQFWPAHYLPRSTTLPMWLPTCHPTPALRPPLSATGWLWPPLAATGSLAACPVLGCHMKVKQPGKARTSEMFIPALLCVRAAPNSQGLGTRHLVGQVLPWASHSVSYTLGTPSRRRLLTAYRDVTRPATCVKSR